MHRIDTKTAQKDKFGAGKNGFTRGNPQTGTPATDLDDDYFDMLQEELCSVVEASGASLEKGRHDQLLTALRALLLSRKNPFGDIKSDGTVKTALENLGLGAAAKIDVATNDEVISGTENKAVTAASLKNRFNTVVLYPNGTEASPPTLTANQRIVIDNPFPGRPVVAQVEVFANGIWAEPYFMAAPYGNSGPAAGATPSYLYETDKIVIQTGNDGVLYRSPISGSAHNLSGGGDAFGGSIYSSRTYRLRVRAI